MLPSDTLDQITRRFGYLEALLTEGADPARLVGIAGEYDRLKPVVASINDGRAALSQREEAEALRADPEMRALAEEELARLEGDIPALEHRLKLALLPRDMADDRPAI